MLKVEGTLPARQAERARSSTLITSTTAGLADARLATLSGRWLRDDESAPVVVINEAVARRDFPAAIR
jgi:hypothetical protein